MSSKTFDRYVGQVIVSAHRLKVEIPQSDIFDELIRTMKIITPYRGPSQKGDFVLCTVECGEEQLERSLCLGNACDPNLDGLVWNRCVNDQFAAVYCGKSAQVKIRSIKHPVSFDIDNGNFATLGIPGVNDKEGYIQWYLERKRGELQAEHAERLLPGIEGQYVRIALSDCPEREKLEQYTQRLISHAVEDQREIMIAYTGSQDSYEQIMEETYHKGAIEANEKAYLAAELAVYKMGAIAKPVMEEIGFDVSSEEYEATVKAYASAMNLSEERYRQLCGFEEFRLSAWAQKLRQMLYQTFLARVEVTAI